MTKRAIICGAGIGGLATGICLSRAGWQVTIYEKDTEIRTAGAGLNLWPNGVRVLKELGLGSQYEEISCSLDYYKTYSSSGELVSIEDLRNWRERYGAALSGVYRRDLSRLLQGALENGSIRLGHEITAVERGDGVLCRFANGETAEGDLLIGADGIGSVVRTSVFGPQEFSAGGLVRWRGLFNLDDVDADPLAEVEVWGADGHLGYLPIGNGRAYWFAAAAGMANDTDEVLAHFSKWLGSPVPGLIAATDRSTVIRSELTDFTSPLKNWSRGRVTLVGDAAHPMLPGMAQGANQALEDVKALGNALASCEDVEKALVSYEQVRIAEVAPVVRFSRSLFDFDDQYGLTKSDSNPLFERYDRIVERRNG
ncbi:FAD-dependent monooxygenase [Rhizobium sp. KVB221]|uniref:FAD-dependent monooxygenase n=1 Tax=Rhizobium setariae TaxID=2801340 RepID=A0A937CMI0_9HYPH|nr:FAD-dependent monooxygenase [Rhizobium setariae]MBL0374345.1 FAD-dependent monooxygenase [Rhizobium setariae]